MTPMQDKLDNTVFFLSELTDEEQYRLINRKAVENPEMQIIINNKRHVQKTDGSVFYRACTDLYQPVNLYPKQLKAGFNEINCMLSTMLFTPPFYNFLRVMCEKIGIKIEELDHLDAISELFRYFINEFTEIPPNIDFNQIEENIDVHKNKLFYVYDELLKRMHEDLVRRYHFSEEVWKDAENDKLTKKPIFIDFSPIVDIFHFQVKRSVKRNVWEIAFLDSINLNLSTKNVAESICHLYPNAEDKRQFGGIEKYPHVLCVKILGFFARSLCSEVFLKGKKYTFSSAIARTTQDKIYQIVKIANKLYEIDSISSVEKVNLYIADNLKEMVAFYSAVDFEFD